MSKEDFVSSKLAQADEILRDLDPEVLGQVDLEIVEVCKLQNRALYWMAALQGLDKKPSPWLPSDRHWLHMELY